MSARSKIVRGKNVFIKVISLAYNEGKNLSISLISNNIQPFIANEFLINYLITRDTNSNLLTPGTTVLVSSIAYPPEYFEQYKDILYSDANFDKFTSMDTYLNNIDDYTNNGLYIRTALIISKTMTGNYEDFIKVNSNIAVPAISKGNSSIASGDGRNDSMLDSLIHLCYLYHKFQQDYQMVHGDPKVQNYTWLKLDQPMDIIYDFRDEYNNGDERIIRRKNVRHVFYLTDLEFVYSPTEKFILREMYFKPDLPIYTDDTIGQGGNKIIVPKLSRNPLYEYNTHLYGNYQQKPQNTDEGITLYDYYGPIYPRMFTIDILVLVKMLLIHYADMFNGDVLRKINMYFTQFIALSNQEGSRMGLSNQESTIMNDYVNVSPASFAKLLSS